MILLIMAFERAYSMKMAEIFANDVLQSLIGRQIAKRLLAPKMHYHS